MDIESKVADQAIYESKLEENRTIVELADDLAEQMRNHTQLILQLIEMLDPEGTIEIPEGLQNAKR